MLSEVLFPAYCAGCYRLGTYICLSCRKTVTYPVQRCLYCGQASDTGLTHARCRRTHGLDGAISFVTYQGVVRSIIKHIKYRLVTDAFPDLFNALDANALKPLAELSRLCRDAVYVPVPLHPSKMRVRGFNQAERIARFCALFTGTPISDIVERTALTNAQAQLRTRRERMLNMTGAFRIRECEGETLKGKTAIIIDDVITSGSTVKSLANILSRGGVTRIYGVSLARG